MFKGRQKTKEKLGEQEADGFALTDLERPCCRRGRGRSWASSGGKGAANCARTKVGTAARRGGYSKLGREG